MYTFYEVRQRDQLFDILGSHYGRAKFLDNKQKIVDQVRANNPRIGNIDLIFPGQVIMLPYPDLFAQSSRPGNSGELPSSVVNSCSAVSMGLSGLDPSTKSLMSSIDYDKIGTAAGKGFVKFVQKTVEGAIPSVEKVALKYYQNKAGTITKGQYDYARPS